MCSCKCLLGEIDTKTGFSLQIENCAKKIPAVIKLQWNDNDNYNHKQFTEKNYRINLTSNKGDMATAKKINFYLNLELP